MRRRLLLTVLAGLETGAGTTSAGLVGVDLRRGPDGAAPIDVVE